ncbi:replicase, partial [Salmonella enterica subsp. enterica serovar Typhimurium]|nr:replicase [Salmonella enterica subsp. enterica serovar Typhimurium]
GSLVLPRIPALRFTGVIPLLWPRLSHSTPDTQFRVGSSLQDGLYARTPRSVRLLRLFR